MSISKLRDKRAALVAAAAVGVPLAFLLPGGSASGASDGSTFTIVESAHGKVHFVDLPPKQHSENQPPSVGDELIFINKVTRDGKRYGFVQALCVVTDSGGKHKPPLFLCNGAFHLPGGTLTVAASGHLEDTVDIAVTGGTGKYEGANGSIRSVTQKDGSSVDTVHLL